MFHCRDNEHGKGIKNHFEGSGAGLPAVQAVALPRPQKPQQKIHTQQHEQDNLQRGNPAQHGRNDGANGGQRRFQNSGHFKTFLSRIMT